MKARSLSTTVEKMTNDDIQRVMEIEHASFSAPWSRQMFLSELSEAPFSSSYVVRENRSRRIVGYITFRVVFDDLSVMNLAVDPAYRKRGIGGELIRFAMRIGHTGGVRRATLEVRATNLAAQNLYKKFGFREVGCRPNYYSRPTEHALVFEYGVNCVL